MEDLQSGNGETRKRRRLPKDWVRVNVGGTCFSTSKLTLTCNSSYFSSHLLGDWADNDADDEDKIIFVDQDPKPFAILLSFMRTGHLHLLRSDLVLSKQVILQAQFLGMDAVLTVVKSRTYHLLDPGVDGSVEDMCMQFDKTYGGIDEAILSGVLPRLFFPQEASDKIVTVDAGGTKFCTLKQALARESLYFRELLEQLEQDTTNCRSEFFIDMNPDLFQYILQAVRNEEMTIPTFESNTEKNRFYRNLFHAARRLQVRKVQLEIFRLLGEQNEMASNQMIEAGVFPVELVLGRHTRQEDWGADII